ncbi:hypothetical protein M409DRAFT_23921 [Zasmidium cellare ATCC 36951]|uniref:DUF7223 domain-containing protein n=1 Tax=Zasmidium cellare ATCC 36951 TaxID=1080233 RepID=A0A6A6CHH7_ZASCE|nr:uncharacterized protein M409DRAFT_23921 [Zasmidium cellare ATCC 36951]KAF2165630.1 hypothetical protein M409DRAFT_23921 [Zasmidium cellare ATCC 36951]
MAMGEPRSVSAHHPRDRRYGLLDDSPSEREFGIRAAVRIIRHQPDLIHTGHLDRNIDRLERPSRPTPQRPLDLSGSSAGIAQTGLQRRVGDSGNVNLAEKVNIPNIFDKKVAGPVSVSLDGTLSSQGNLQWSVEVDGLSPSDASVTLQTTGVSFTLTPQLSISSAIDAIPAASIDFPEIPLGSPSGPFDTKIVLFLIVGAQADLGQVSAEIDASIDLTLTLTDGDFTLKGGASPSLSGFSPSFTANNPDIQGQVTLQSTIGPTVALVLQASVFGEGVEGGIQLEGPEAGLTFTAEADSSGVCGGDQTLGVDLDIGVGVQLDGIFAFGNLESASTSSLNIYSTSAAVFSTCIAGGPTVGSGSTTSAAPPPASSTAASSTPAEPSESSAPPGANPINGLPPAASTGLNPINGLPPAAPTSSTASAGVNPVNGLPPADTTGLNPVNGLPPAAPTTLSTTTTFAVSLGANPINGFPPAGRR